MTTYKNFLRDFLGLALITSTVFAALSILLDILAFIAYLTHQDATAATFFHESFYFLAFLVPPFFLGKLVNRPDLVSAAREYRLMKNESERD